jgi:hypothetical protein
MGAEAGGVSDELTRYPATELARMIRTGEVSPVEVLTAHLRRVADVNPKINALVQVAPDARDRARAAEAAVARGDELGSPHGVPFTVTTCTGGRTTRTIPRVPPGGAAAGKRRSSRPTGRRAASAPTPAAACACPPISAASPR